jgi:hypothetical protein
MMEQQAQQTAAAAVAAAHNQQLVAQAVAELFTSGLRFNYGRTILCTN